MRIVVAGAGDPRHLFATLSHFDMLYSKMGDLHTPSPSPAVELIVCDQNPAVVARTLLIFDGLLSFCKRLFINGDLPFHPQRRERERERSRERERGREREREREPKERRGE